MNRIAVLVLLALGVAAGAFARGGPPPPDAPEIDPGTIGTASALICSVVLMARSRRKR